jgi:hypothetical protein
LDIIQIGLILLLKVQPLEEVIFQELIVLIQFLILAKNLTCQLLCLLFLLVILFILITSFVLRLLMEEIILIVIPYNVLLSIKEGMKALLLLLVVSNPAILAASGGLLPELRALLEQVAGVNVLQVQRLLLSSIPLLGLPFMFLVLR